METSLDTKEINMLSVSDEALNNMLVSPAQIQQLKKGFIFSAGKSVVGEDPFYIEVHQIGEDEFSVSANKNGILSKDDLKSLRKCIKQTWQKVEQPTYIEPIYEDDYYDPELDS